MTTANEQHEIDAIQRARTQWETEHGPLETWEQQTAQTDNTTDPHTTNAFDHRYATLPPDHPDHPNNRTTPYLTHADNNRLRDPTTHQQPTSHNHNHEPTSWAPVDMAEALTLDPIEPKYLQYGQNLSIFYPGKTHILYASSESGKSWVALYAAAQILTGDDWPDERVLYIDHEDDARSIGERLTALGVPPDTITHTDRFRYVNPTEPLTDHHHELHGPAAEDLRTLLKWEPTFVVIDGVSEAMTEENLDPISNSHTAEWFRISPRRFEKIGACVVMIDHTAKSHGDGPPTELGAQHKRAAVSGASFLVDAPRRPGRAVLNKPVEGLIRLRLAKDRGGYHRGRYPGEYPVTAELTITSYPDGGVIVHADEHNETEGTSPVAIDIAVWLNMYNDGSGSAICTGLGKDRNDRTIRAELSDMVARQELSVEDGPHRAKIHRLTDHGRTVYRPHLDPSDTSDVAVTYNHLRHSVSTSNVE